MSRPQRNDGTSRRVRIRGLLVRRSSATATDEPKRVQHLSQGDQHGVVTLSVLLWLLPLAALIWIAVLVTDEFESISLGLMAAGIIVILTAALATVVRPSGRN
jgi:hypothetical protein